MAGCRAAYGAASRCQGRSFVASASPTGSLGDPALDSEPLAAPWRGESAGGAGKDAPPALRAARRGEGGTLLLAQAHGVADGFLGRINPPGRDELRQPVVEP